VTIEYTLPTVGEQDWGPKLNTAIDDIVAGANAAYLPWSGLKDADGSSRNIGDAEWGAGDNWWNVNFNAVKDGYAFHLTASGPEVRLFGIGVDTEGSTGLLISQKEGATAGGVPSKGIYLDHQITIDDAGDEGSYGFHGRQASTLAPLVFLESYFGGSAPVLRLKGSSWGSGQILFDQILSSGDTAWRFYAEDGRGEFLAPMKFAASASNLGGVTARNAGGQAVLFYGYTGTPGSYYRFAIRRGNTNPTELMIGGAGAGTTIDGTETYDPFIRMDVSGVTERIGFLGASPAGRSAAIVNVTGGSVIDVEARVAVNAILTEMRTRGFVTP